MWNAAVAAGALAALSLLAVSRAAERPGPAGWALAGWALAGWALMALAGVAGGHALERYHGRPGAGFLGALAACILTRLFGAAAGAFAAAAWGEPAVWAFLAGLGVTFLPLQLLEIAWFMNKTRRTSPVTPVRGRDAYGN